MALHGEFRKAGLTRVIVHGDSTGFGADRSAIYLPDQNCLASMPVSDTSEFRQGRGVLKVLRCSEEKIALHDPRVAPKIKSIWN